MHPIKVDIEGTIDGVKGVMEYGFYTFVYVAFSSACRQNVNGLP